jgi:ABC-type Mn2+/Zn2+ transport system permease subunit
MIKTFFTNLISIDELKISSLIICLLLTLVCSLVFLFLYKNIPDNILNLLFGEIVAVSGINIANLFRK